MQKDSETKWLIRKEPRKNGYGEIVTPKSHIWIDDKHNTMCNMYPKGNFDKQKWEVSNNFKFEECRRCIQHKYKHGGEETPINENL